jgi:hypothetical protein
LRWRPSTSTKYSVGTCTKPSGRQLCMWVQLRSRAQATCKHHLTQLCNNLSKTCAALHASGELVESEAASSTLCAAIHRHQAVIPVFGLQYGVSYYCWSVPQHQQDQPRSAAHSLLLSALPLAGTSAPVRMPTCALAAAPSCHASAQQRNIFAAAEDHGKHEITLSGWPTEPGCSTVAWR